MPNFIDLTGRRFERLVVIRRTTMPPTTKSRSIFWECRCDCGQTIVASQNRLSVGDNKSCGCYKKDMNVDRGLIHGHQRIGKTTPTYRSWASMIQRCCNSSSKHYSAYGGRGITVCYRWLKFENFLQDMGERPSGTSIDRRTNDLGYDPSNCRWATPTQQILNRRYRNRWGFKGITKVSGRYVAQIGFRGKNTRLGIFSTPIEAARAYDAAALQLHGEDARINGV